MKSKGTWLIWTDAAAGISFVLLAVSGIILRWVLPAGSGGGGGRHGSGEGFRGGRGPAPELLDLTRHEWGDVHFWIAAGMVGLILLHLALHWGWILAAGRRAIGLGARRASGRARPAITNAR